MFPDIVDKTLLFLKVSNGRSYFHSLLFVFLSFLVLFLLSKGNKRISLSFLIGMLFHLFLDLPEIPIFYPFISYDFAYIDDPIPHWTRTLLTSPIVQVTEIIGLGILIFITAKYRLYKSRELVRYLKTTPGVPMKYPSTTKSEVQIVED